MDLRTFAFLFCSVLFFICALSNIVYIVYVCFFMQRWLDADSISKVLVGIRGVEEDGVPPRVTRGSHFGREHGEMGGRAAKEKRRRRRRRRRRKKDQVGDGKENQGVGK
jgi:hypothetical protein